MRVYQGLSELAANYDAFLVDLWGVIHDGSNLYPNVLGSLQELKLADKTVIFLSNAPRRASKVAAQLLKFGIAGDLYSKIVTSGEVGFHHLSQNFAQQAYLHIGPMRDADLLSESDCIMTEHAAEASFAIVTGFYEDNSIMDRELQVLDQALSYNLPLYCVNPDLVVVKQSGERISCAGFIAAKYAQMGGVVHYFGKPHIEIYTAVRNLLPTSTRIIAIGDSVETDIKGASLCGIDTLLVTGGILQINNPREIDAKQRITKLLAEQQISASQLIANFCW